MATPAPTEYSPMRGSLFQRWLMVWHTLYIGGLLATLSVALWSARGAWGWREVALVCIVAFLIALYARVLIFPRRWPYPNGFLALYFGSVIALLGIAVWLNPIFSWAIAMLFGQMFGILPPLLAAPGVLAVVGVIWLAANEWHLPAEMSWRSGLAVAVQVAGMFILYLYIHHVFRTSQERAELVNELTAAKEQLERARDAETELAALRERERVARDLHDGLGHSLVALSVQLEAIQRLYPVDPALASARIDEMKQLTRDSMTQLRSAIDGLRAPERGERPLSVVLRERAVEAGRQTGAEVTIEIDEEIDRLPPRPAEAVWRVVQEAIANVERHATPRHIEARVHSRSGYVQIRVADDGPGLPPNAEQRPGHYGLRGMRERVEGLGGVLELAGNEDGGTVVSVRIPS